MVPSQAVNPEVRSLSPHPIVCRNLTQSSALFPQPRPLCWSLITPAVNLNQNPNRQMHLEGSPCPQNDPIPPWSHIENVSHLQTNFLPHYHPGGGSWGPSQSVNQSNQSIHQVTSKLLMDWLLKGRGCGFQFGPTLTRSADCSNSSEKQNAPTSPSPILLPHPPHPSTSPSVHQSIFLPLLSAASRHQVDGLLQFVPQFVFATVPIPIQRCQDLQRQRTEVILAPTSVWPEFEWWSVIPSQNRMSRWQ